MFNIKDLFASRIGGKEYLNNSCLSNIDKMKRVRIESLNSEYDMLDFSSEESDEMLNKKISETICEEIKSREKIDYNNEYLEFNKACCAYLRVEQNVDLDYKNEIIRCSGIKEVLNDLPLAFINEDDYIITAGPGINCDMGKWVGGKIYEYKLNKFNNYLIDFEDIDESILKKCKLLYLNYPNNPTGKVASKEFFKEVVKYAKQYNFIVVNDASYIDLCFDSNDKISFLSIEGARDVGVEIHSFSKNFSMGKYKIGFIAGNKDIIKAYGTIREAIGDYSLFVFQKSAIVALNNYENIVNELKTIYLRRHKLMKETLEKVGFKIEVPKVGFYQYVNIPKSCNGVAFETSEEFALWLIENLNIAVIPYEEKYIRISMSFVAEDEEIEKDIAEKLGERLSKYRFEF